MTSIDALHKIDSKMQKKVLDNLGTLTYNPKGLGRNRKKILEEIQKTLDNRQNLWYHVKVRYGERLYLVN